ncbi:MAG: dTMP kinase [Candidatus Dependentiae bacterium]|jgi:dTMP kinase|nr:dTMP kinase [Candidatus Dependentiae bacterium]
MNRLRQGFWVVFEGIDGVGKSTVLELVFKELERREYAVIQTGEAGGTPLGREIRQLLDFAIDRPVPLAEYLLFAADRAQHMQRVIIPALKNRKVVISDRSTDSSLAYQGFGRGVDRDFIRLVNAATLQQLQPQRVFYLRLSVDDAFRRLEERGGVATAFEREQKEFFERVADGFDTIFADRPDVITLDATLNPSQLAHIICTDLLRSLHAIAE